jgi:hypothetical protein
MKRVKFSTNTETGIKYTKTVDSSSGPVYAEYNPSTNLVRVVSAASGSTVFAPGTDVGLALQIIEGGGQTPSVVARALLVKAGVSFDRETRIRRSVDNFGASAVLPGTAASLVTGSLLETLD